jgi:hypothetical protein
LSMGVEKSAGPLATRSNPKQAKERRRPMSKPLRLLTIGSVLVAAVVFPATASAQNPHLKGRNAVAFTDNGLTLTASVSYAGLGNFDTLQNVTASANPTSTCTNPAGTTQPPGQNPAEVDVTGSTAVPAGDIKNGNVTIATTTNPPVTPIAGAPDCPNPQWTENITDMAFTSATITLFQDANENGTFEAGELVLTVNCTFSSPTSNGPVSGFTCTTA